MTDNQNFPEDMLFEYRKRLVEQHYQDNARFEQVMITISSGVLGVSVVFLKDIIDGSPAFNSLYWLYASWILVVFSLLMILFSFTPAMRNKEHLIAQIDDAVKKKQLPSAWISKKSARMMNLIAVISLVLGIGSYLVFAILNI